MDNPKKDTRLLCSGPQLIGDQGGNEFGVRIYLQAHRDYNNTEEGLKIIERAENRLITASNEKRLPNGCTIDHVGGKNNGFTITISYTGLAQALQARDSIHMAVLDISGAVESNNIDLPKH